MQSTSRAPVLSATLRRDSCWIIGRPPPLPGSLQDLDETPALGAAERTALDHAHGVADARLVLLVVGVQCAARADDLLVHAVPTGHVDSDGDRLVGPVGDDNALAHLRLAARFGLGRGGLRPRLAGTALAHLLAVRTAMPRLAVAELQTLPRPLLGRAHGSRLPAVTGPLLLAPLLGVDPFLGLGRLGGGCLG